MQEFLIVAGAVLLTCLFVGGLLWTILGVLWLFGWRMK